MKTLGSPGSYGCVPVSAFIDQTEQRMSLLKGTKACSQKMFKS